MLVGKPGLDGHSNGAEQIAVAARDSGIEVVYEGIRLTPARIANAALEEGVHIVGLSILSGSHMPLVKEVLRRMRELGIGEIPVVVGGIIPPEDAQELQAAGVARVYTPKDYEIQDIMSDLVDIAGAAAVRAVLAWTAMCARGRQISCHDHASRHRRDQGRAPGDAARPEVALALNCLGVFGSWVRREQAGDSDLDLLVDFDCPVGFELVALKDELERRLACPSTWSCAAPAPAIGAVSSTRWSRCEPAKSLDRSRGISGQGPRRMRIRQAA